MSIGAMGGVLDGVRYLSKAIVDEASKEQVYTIILGWGPMSMSLGLGRDSKDFRHPTRTMVGWGGSGGSWAEFDQRSEISAGYAMNNWITDQFPDPRQMTLWRALASIAEKL